jgi:hypothetical protein
MVTNSSIKPKPSPAKAGNSTGNNNRYNNKNHRVNYVKVDSIVVKGNAVIVYAENTKNGVKVYIAGDELELDQLPNYIGRYKILDKNGNPVPRIKGNNYMWRKVPCLFFHPMTMMKRMKRRAVNGMMTIMEGI